MLVLALALILLQTSPIVFAQSSNSLAGLENSTESACEQLPASKRWSDPTSWPDGIVPVAGDDVTIAIGTHIFVDITPPALGNLSVAGILSFEDKALDFQVEQMTIRGTVCIGSETEPRENKLVLTLTGAKSEDVLASSRGIMVMFNGTLFVNARATTVTYSKLAATANAQDTTIEIEQQSDWRVGDRIVVSSSDYAWRQAEERVITSISGKTISFAEPLKYQHYGDLQTIANQTLDTRAEVVHLSRPVVIQGADDSLTQEELFGGHVMAMSGSTIRIDGAEFRRMGQSGQLGRYPLHWHMAGDASGQFVKNSSFHNNFNRCITIHGTQFVTVENNVAYRSFGHCYFLEDGSEFGNVFKNNIGLSIDKPKAEHVLIPSDTGFLGPSVFWISHPDNVLEGNIAAGTDGSGFWYAFSKHPTGLSKDPSLPLRHLAFGEFKNNIAHSSTADGLRFDDGADVDGLVPDTGLYEPLTDPYDINSEALWTNLSGFVAFKNRNRGAWVRIRRGYLTDCVLSDNAVGANLSGHNSYLDNCLIVGESANRGTPEPWEPTSPDGGSIAKPWLDCEACIRYNIRGFELYDGKVWVQNSTFANFENNSLRKASALSQLDYSSYEVNPENYIENVSFTENTNLVYFETRTLEHLLGQPGEDGYRSTVFRDLDGSMGITPNSAITVNNPFLIDDRCELNNAWNAYVCSPDIRFASLRFDARPMGHIELSRKTELTRPVSHTMTGTPERENWYKANVLLGYDYEFKFQEEVGDFRIGMGDSVIEGDSLIVQVPYVNEYPYVSIENFSEQSPVQVSSLDGLRSSLTTAFYITDRMLYIKMVVPPKQKNIMLRVCSTEGCELQLEPKENPYQTNY